MPAARPRTTRLLDLPVVMVAILLLLSALLQPYGASSFVLHPSIPRQSRISQRSTSGAMLSLHRPRSTSSSSSSTLLQSRSEGGERLHKLISRSGYCSLRDAEAMVLQGRVTVNGQRVCAPGAKAVPHRDLVQVDGNTIFLPSPKDLFWVLYNKPKGISSIVARKEGGDRGKPADDADGGDAAGATGAARGSLRVEEKIPDIRGLGFVAVSALPEWATGALVLTNDKAWVHKITHPSYGHFSRYLLGVEGDHMQAIVDLFNREMQEREREKTVEPGRERSDDTLLFDPDSVEYNRRTRRTTLDVQTLDASPRRLVARLAAAGVTALASLRRMSFGSVDLAGLRPGQWRVLRASEVAGLKRMSSKLPL